MPTLSSIPLDEFRIHLTVYEAVPGELLQVRVDGCPSIIMRAVSYPPVGRITQGAVDFGSSRFLEEPGFLSQPALIISYRYRFLVRDPDPAPTSAEATVRAGHIYLPRGPDAMPCLAVTLPDNSAGFLPLKGQHRGKVFTPQPDIYLGLLELEQVEPKSA